MHPVMRKTLGGLSRHYYFRQFVFGLAVAAFVFLMSTQGGGSMRGGMLFLLVVNTLLYPYSRFVYESIISFVLGENVFFVNAFVMIVFKFLTMTTCWSLALFVAPVGLAYLYFHHSRAEQ